jgi:energy-coupling factor transporter ATP-binding protein EcfA2/energy-coupling factor transporter transmembrane protein EcfT
MAAIVSTEGLTYRYPQNNYGLDPITLAIEPGERVLVAGPSGCGKSTLARCLTGLIPHLYHGTMAGDVWLGGLHTAQTPLWQLSERAGLVFQNPAAQMLGQSVEEEILFGLENLGLPRDTMRDRTEAILVHFGLETMRDRSPQTLSGGEQQKLALAAIIARQPAVLVLDEPLSMLDGTAATGLVAHLAGPATADTTVVVCEHREEYLRPLPDLRALRLDGRPAREDAISPPDLPGIATLPAVLEVEGLSVQLGGRPVLRNLTFALEPGQVVAIVGCNGVGKTTLLRALAGLQKHQGRITAGGGRPDLGMVFQNADLQLFNASVRDEVLYRVPDPDMALYAWLLAALGLTRYEEVPPLLLSEGEKKRVALALVLMRRPRHGLLLDEPSLGQDAGHKAMLVRLARALAAAGRLVIFTTHDLPLAAQADRLLLLGPDGFVADGPPARVLDDAAAWASIGLSVPDWVRPTLPATPAPTSEVHTLLPPAAAGDTGGGPSRPSIAVSPASGGPSRPLATAGETESGPSLRLGTSGRARQLVLVEDSPLRGADPRTKLALSLCASLAVMLSLEKLVAFMGLYAILLLWAHLLPEAARQVWRLKWVFLVLFVVDWLFVSLDLAVIITLRLTLLAGAFALFFATTTPGELRLALEWMRVPYRYAFSLSLAIQSVGLLDDEWRAIREAQQARGAWAPPSGWHHLTARVRDMVALAVPAIVLTTKRAWAMTESAYARGFDSPHRHPYGQLAMGWLDWALLAGTTAVAVALLLWR